MPEKISKKEKFKKFLKRNMTPTWAKRFSYQVFAFLVSVAMIVGVATYAFTKSYDERKLTFVDGFTVTAHAGAFDTTDNTMESVQTAIDNGAKSIELDVRQRPDGTVVMSRDIITTNNDGVELRSILAIAKDSDVTLNLDIKETRLLSALHDLLVEYNMLTNVCLIGIEIYQANSVMENCPDVDYYINYIPSRIKIFSDDYQQRLISLIEKTGAVGINCNKAYASRTLSDMLHKNGYKLSVWTVDKKFDMKRVLVSKPDNIITRYPDRLQEVIDDWGK
jgi:glycerophosphoryl diester phosphodiesterase